jgi:hypothetical protein
MDFQLICLTKYNTRMKRLWLFAILALTAGVFTSCDTDPVDPIIDDNFSPTITLLTENPNVGGPVVFSSDATLELADSGATLLFVGIKGEDFTGTMKTLEVFLNDEKVDESLVTMIAADGTDIGVNNPALLVDPFNAGFSFEVQLRTMAEYGVNTFRFLLTDDGDLTDEVSITITTVPAGTDLTGNLTGVLLNQGGPGGTGGLDLDEGLSLGSGDDAVEIKDNGIDAGPVASNWLQTISGANDAVIRVLDRPAMGEGYDFATVTTVEEVQSAWDNGIVLAGTDTEMLVVGDEFIVENADASRRYLLQVSEVNVTAADNGDNYVFNVKY